MESWDRIYKGIFKEIRNISQQISKKLSADLFVYAMFHTWVLSISYEGRIKNGKGDN